jgi:hypothetical protein
MRAGREQQSMIELERVGTTFCCTVRNYLSTTFGVRNSYRLNCAELRSLKCAIPVFKPLLKEGIAQIAQMPCAFSAQGFPSLLLDDFERAADCARSW